jgi:hypothetical protein
MVDVEYLSFDDFRRKVGESEQRVRAALMALGLKGKSLPGDRRRRDYDPEWIEQVKEYITRHAE